MSKDTTPKGTKFYRHLFGGGSNLPPFSVQTSVKFSNFCSLHSKHFRANSSRTLGREQKKKGMMGEGRVSLLPSPSPFFNSRSNFRAITRLATGNACYVGYDFCGATSLLVFDKSCTNLASFLFLTLWVLMVTNINFLLTISIHCQEIWLWQLIKWSSKRKCLDLLWNSLNTFFKEVYRDQFGEFVCGYWCLKGC